MGNIFALVWSWIVEPPDDWLQIAFVLVLPVGIVLLMFFQAVSDPYVERARRRLPSNPGRLLAVYFGVGAVLGAISHFLSKKPLIHPTGLRLVSLILAPLLVGMIVSTVAYFRGAPRSVSPRLGFLTGLAFASGVVVMRVAMR
ncbi:MAG: hypothetical protein JWO36_3409 [Myxococcales bacterium]|nr:hypothetical protein [Myxococcales bacterium]